MEEEEAHAAIREMAGNKDPGPDGFSMAFFHSWEVINEDLMRVLSDFLYIGILSKSINSMSITLVPKKDKSSNR